MWRLLQSAWRSELQRWAWGAVVGPVGVAGRFLEVRLSLEVKASHDLGNLGK